MKVHVVSETEFIIKGQGVHTAFVDHVELLKEKDDVNVVVNNEGKGDIFHSHSYGPYFFWKGINYKGRRILTVHVIPDSIKGSLPQWKLWHPLVKWYFRQVYSYCDVCIAISPMVENAIKELNVISEIVPISNPVPLGRWKFSTEKRSTGRKLFEADDNDFVVLGVGQLQGRKGVEDFIEIARNIPEAKFVWVGGRPFGALTEGYERINKSIAKAPKNVKFTGLLELSEMPFAYAAGDIMIFPSYQENCPLAPLEAAACGLPVIFRDIMEYELLFENPYLKAKNNNEFTSIINNLMSDKDYFRQGAAKSEKLITQFDKEEIRKKLITLYKRLNKGGSSDNIRQIPESKQNILKTFSLLEE